MSRGQALVTVLLIALATLATRALPFLLFPADRPTPRYVVYLGTVLPSATIGMLVVFCLKDTAFLAAPHGLPELIAVAGVALCQLVWRSTMVSIAAGTVLYMILVQTVF